MYICILGMHNTSILMHSKFKYSITRIIVYASHAAQAMIWQTVPLLHYIFLYGHLYIDVPITTLFSELLCTIYRALAFVICITSCNARHGCYDVYY